MTIIVCLKVNLDEQQRDFSSYFYSVDQKAANFTLLIIVAALDIDLDDSLD